MIDPKIDRATTRQKIEELQCALTREDIASEMPEAPGRSKDAARKKGLRSPVPRLHVREIQNIKGHPTINAYAELRPCLIKVMGEPRTKPGVVFQNKTVRLISRGDSPPYLDV